MNTRTGDIGIFVLEQGRRASLRRIIIACLVICGLILYVGEKVRIVQLGYRIEALEKEKQELERTNRSLRIEAASLASPSRIEEIAIKRFGMTRPAKQDIVVVKRPAEQRK